MRPATELATRISRALISASTAVKPDRSWTPSLEHTLHKLGCREVLTPSLVAHVIDPHLLCHHSLALGFFNWATQQPGFAHNSISYQSVFKSLSSSRQFNAVDSLLKQVKAQSLPLDSLTYSFVIKTLLQGKKTFNAFCIFSDAKSGLSCLDPKVCNSLLAALSSEGCLENAFKVFEEMTRREVGFTTLGFGVFIWKLCAKNNLDVVLTLLDRVNNNGKSSINGSVIALLVVHGLCKVSRIDEALWVLTELRMKKCKPDFMAYRIVAEALRSTGSVVDVNIVLKMKRKLGVAPRSNDYREFISGLIAERLILEAKEIGEVIANGNFSVEDDVLNQLIASVSSIDPSSALMFFDFMVRKGTLPALLTLSILSKNLCKHNKIDELLDVYDRLSQHDYFSDMESCNVMFSFLCKAGKVREAYGVLQEMKKKGLGPDISMYNFLMETCCRHDLIRPAKKLWDEMFVTGCGVNLRTYNILIGKLSELAEVEESLRLFNHMSEKGVTPDAATYKFLLDGLCQETKFEVAVEVFNKCVNQDAMLAWNVLSTFILKLCEKGQFLLSSKVLHDLTNDIGHSGPHVLLMKCLVGAKEFRLAVEHVKRIQDTSSSMFHTIVSEVLASLSTSIEPNLLRQLVQAMEEQGVDLRDTRNGVSP